MRKLTFLACAAMLTSAVIFTGCKNDNEPKANVPQITANIAVSLPNQVGGMRRMPGTTVQTNGASDFVTNNMMTGVVLVPFAPSAYVTSSSTRLGSNITLGAAKTTVAPDGNNKAQIYEGKVPVGTSSFLFYAKSGNSSTDGFAKGSLTPDYSATNPSGFSFSLGTILTNATDVQTAKSDALLAYLNAIAQTTDGTKAWRDYTAADNEGYAELFAAYKTLHYLNSYGVQAMLTDFYQSIETNTDALAINLRAAIANTTDASWNSTTKKVELVSDLLGYPADVNMPEGAIRIVYDETSDPSAASYHTFVYADPQTQSYGSTGAQMSASVMQYTYPSELYYYANTKIKTSNASEAEHYVDAASWSSILTNYTAGKSVTSKTRAVALEEIIQYAVARLDVKLKAAQKLRDNDPLDSDGNPHQIDNPNGYQLTGVLVGGQKNVGWDFTPLTSSPEYIIYDKNMTNTVKAAVSDYSTNFNSTLVLETAANEDVLIAIELLNNSGVAFYGVDGIVPAGGKFYLVGKLLAASATETDNKVFKQDYTTTAKLTIGSLKKAYCVVPDLRTPQLEIGLSVNLEWQSGHEYEIEL